MPFVTRPCRQTRSCQAATITGVHCLLSVGCGSTFSWPKDLQRQTAALPAHMRPRSCACKLPRGCLIICVCRVVIIDPSWNPAHDLQAQDRAFRLGQVNFLFFELGPFF